MVVASLLLGCSNGAHDSNMGNVSTTSNKPSSTQGDRTPVAAYLIKCFKKQGDIVATDITFRKDTLAIVSRGWFFYYPFGKFQRSKDLNNINPVLRLKIEHENATKPNNYAVDLYRLYYENSFVKFIYQPETKRYEIVSGSIVNPEIALNNGVKTGMTKTDFLNIYFPIDAQKKIGNVDVIKFISALDGIFHYYIFKDDKLVEIDFNTDYQVNKK